MTNFVAAIERLESFEKALDEPQISLTEETSTIEIVEDSNLHLEHLTLQTPNYQRTLVQDVSVEVKAGGGSFNYRSKWLWQEFNFTSDRQLMELRQWKNLLTKIRGNSVFTPTSVSNFWLPARSIALSTD